MDRRNFLMSSAAAFGAASHAIATPSETVRIAQVGTGSKNPGGIGRGREHLLAWAQVPNVEVAAICDVDPRHADAGVDIGTIQLGFSIRACGLKTQSSFLALTARSSSITPISPNRILTNTMFV